MTTNKIITKIVFSLFSGNDLSSMGVKHIKPSQWDTIYSYLYKQKILQHSFDCLKQLSVCDGGKNHVEEILFKTSEYINKTKSRDNMYRAGLYFLTKCLTNNGIEHISLKGPLFSEMYYNGLGKRVCGDIDLLINKKDIYRVKNILLDTGYDIDERLFEKCIIHHYHFQAKKENITYEIHWNIDYGEADYWNYLLCNSFFVSFNDIKIRVLNNEGEFLLFIVSISKDWFTRAGTNKYLDLLKIIKSEKLNYKHIFQIIEQFNLNNRCYAVLFCLQHFCKCKTWPKIPASVFTKIFARLFLTKEKTLMCKSSLKLTRKIGEALLWKDVSFTSVPNIYKS